MANRNRSRLSFFRRLATSASRAFWTRYPRVVCLSLLLSSPLLRAQMEIGRISGTVTDSRGARVSGAGIFLENPLSGRQEQTQSSDLGQFQFENLPYGTYVVRVSAAGFGSSKLQATVRSNVPVRVSVQLAIATAKLDLRVEAPDILQHETPRTEVIIDENQIKLSPSVVRRDQLQALVSTAPGWNTENDGLMHIRGVDDGTLYVMDGVPTPDRVDGLFAGSFNTDAITSLDIITGNIPAEFGDRSGAGRLHDSRRRHPAMGPVLCRLGTPVRPVPRSCRSAQLQQRRRRRVA
jgi:hypothetical protein